MTNEILDDAPEYRRHLSEQEQERKLEIQWDLEFAQRQISRARIILYLLIGFQLLGLVVAISAGMYGYVEIGIQIALACIFGVSAYLSLEFPFSAFLGALSLYLVLVFLASLINPFFLLQGILWKLVVVLFLSIGIYYGYERRRLLEELATL